MISTSKPYRTRVVWETLWSDQAEYIDYLRASRASEALRAALAILARINKVSGRQTS